MNAKYNWHTDAFFGIHYDLHAADNDTELYAELSEELLESRLGEVMPYWVQCDCKGHPGYASWPTRTGTASPGIAQDGLRIYRNVTRKLGIKLGVHYSGVIDQLAVKQYPDWARKDADGNPDERSVCVLSGYLEKLMIPQLMEVLDEYDVDGFWIDGDNWGAKACWCPRCRAAFRKISGGREAPLTEADELWGLWLDLHRNNFLDYVKKYADAVHNRKKDCLVCSNWLYTMRQPDNISVPVDYLSGDFAPNWGGNRAALEGRILDCRDMPWDLMAWGYTRNFHIENSPFCLKTATHLCQEASEVLALGGSLMVYLIPQRNGWLGRQDNRIIKEVSNFCQARKTACFNTQTVPQAAILHSAKNYYKHNNPLFNLGTAAQPVEGALHLMQEIHRPVDILPTDAAIRRMQEYKLIIIPEQICLEDELLKALTDFVKAGGTLLATGSGLPEKHGELFGVETASNNIPGENNPSSMPGITFFNSKFAVSDNRNAAWLTGTCHAVSLRDGCEALVHGLKDLDAGKNGNGEIIGTRRKSGRGMVYGIYGELFRTYFENHNYVIRNFVGQLIEQMEIDWLVDVEAPPWVEVVLRKKDGCLMANLINRSSGEPLSPERFIVHEVVPVRNVVVKIKLKKGLKLSVDSIGGIIEYTYGSDGLLLISLSELHIHCVVTVAPRSGSSLL